MWKISRRGWLQATGLASLGGSLLGGARLTGQTSGNGNHAAHGSHVMGTVGRASLDVFNPTTFLRSWNFSELPPDERAKFYRETPRPDGTLLREYEIYSV